MWDPRYQLKQAYSAQPESTKVRRPGELPAFSSSLFVPPDLIPPSHPQLCNRSQIMPSLQHCSYHLFIPQTISSPLTHLYALALNTCRHSLYAHQLSMQLKLEAQGHCNSPKIQRGTKIQKKKNSLINIQIYNHLSSRFLPASIKQPPTHTHNQQPITE